MKKDKFLISIIVSNIFTLNLNAASLWDNTSIFNNVTSAHIATDPMSQSTYISGGGIEVRFKRTGNFPPIFAFGAPSLKTSCSGISFDAGYAMFMNLERLGQQLSQAGASIAYGVLIGLVYTMPGVEQAFTKLNEWSQWLQTFLSNSCNAGVAIGKELGSTAWRNVEGAVNEITAKIPSPKDYMDGPVNLETLLKRIIENGTDAMKSTAYTGIMDDVLKDVKGGAIATYINSLVKRGEENITFSTSEMIEFKPLDNIGLTESTKITSYFISSIIDDIAIDKQAIISIVQDMKADNYEKLAEKINEKGGKEKTLKSIQARNKNTTNAFISFMLNGQDAVDKSVFSNLQGLEVALISLKSQAGIKEEFVVLSDTTLPNTNAFSTFEGYIKESKKLVYSTYNDMLITLKKVQATNPITGTPKVTAAYPVMYDLLRNLVFTSEDNKIVHLDTQEPRITEILNYVAYKNAIALVSIVIDNMYQAIITASTEVSSKVKDGNVTNPVSKNVMNDTDHITNLKKQLEILNKEFEKIKDELNEIAVRVERDDSVRKINERFLEILKERNIKKEDKE